ncbi:glucose-1-phosphate adenylyltransferase [Candidatus Electrothrix aarhusensis]|uniref:Glucose-1-phosphate adenylyltransferase n=1 Tax=Candidatus Electrothrix aarhusensis TaxID=1859131 RepID=A0A3S3QTA7_9BACT|nr:glucose-1-phosphate adenylyltransferase [Candidatus Electrothrix aarhusensis]
MDRGPARFVQGCTVQSSMISAGSVIEGTVLNSVLSPGVIVRKGAVVRDSVILEDSVIEAGAEVDLVVCDKRVHIGEGAIVGHGDEKAKKISNQEYPTHLYSGITLIGKEVLVPEKMKIGRNCIIIRPGKKERDERVLPTELKHGGIF